MKEGVQIGSFSGEDVSRQRSARPEGGKEPLLVRAVGAACPQSTDRKK